MTSYQRNAELNVFDNLSTLAFFKVDVEGLFNSASVFSVCSSQCQEESVIGDTGATEREMAATTLLSWAAVEEMGQATCVRKIS